MYIGSVYHVVWHLEILWNSSPHIKKLIPTNLVESLVTHQRIESHESCGISRHVSAHWNAWILWNLSSRISTLKRMNLRDSFVQHQRVHLDVRNRHDVTQQHFRLIKQHASPLTATFSCRLFQLHCRVAVWCHRRATVGRCHCFFACKHSMKLNLLCRDSNLTNKQLNTVKFIT